MANQQPKDAHIRISHSITEAIMTRNFSKRQRAILDLVLRLSWGCGKKYAVIPKLKDFQIVGIAATKIKSELEWLVNTNVIEWHKETNEYGFLKDFEKWSISLVPEYNNKRFNELLHVNLTSQNGNFIPETVSEITSQNGNKLNEKGRNFPKSREVGLTANIDDKLNCGLSKESIKESNNIYTPEFEFFYSQYPRSEDKRRSFNNWKKCLKEYNVDDLMQACENYKSKVQGTEMQFIKNSANFLGRDKFFEDYIKQEPIHNRYADVKM